MSQHRDYMYGFVAGLIAGFFAIPTLINLEYTSSTILFGAVVALPVCALIGVWLGKLVASRLAVAVQIVRFIIVGVANTSIDFGILNLLSLATGIKGGIEIGGVNILGFIVAFLNSYWWNKHWVFKKDPLPGEMIGQSKPSQNSEFFKFFLVNIIGIVINSSVVILITTYVTPIFGVSDTLWLNLAKVVATCFSLVWNFLGFKFIVFR